VSEELLEHQENELRKSLQEQTTYISSARHEGNRLGKQKRVYGRKCKRFSFVIKSWNFRGQWFKSDQNLGICCCVYFFYFFKQKPNDQESYNETT
jgi:hypothetical protein